MNAVSSGSQAAIRPCMQQQTNIQVSPATGLPSFISPTSTCILPVQMQVPVVHIHCTVHRQAQRLHGAHRCEQREYSAELLL
jgi:hypothetical protein